MKATNLKVRNVLDAAQNGKSRDIGQWAQPSSESPPLLCNGSNRRAKNVNNLTINSGRISQNNESNMGLYWAETNSQETPQSHEALWVNLVKTIDYDGTLTEHASPNFCQTDGMWWGVGRVDRRLACQEWDQLSAELPNVTGHQLTFDGWCILAHICQICTAIMLATFVREFTKRLGGLFGHLYERRGRSIWNGITHQTLEGGGMTPFPQCLIQLSKVVCHQWHILNGCSVV